MLWACSWCEPGHSRVALEQGDVSALNTSFWSTAQMSCVAWGSPAGAAHLHTNHLPSKTRCRVCSHSADTVLSWHSAKERHTKSILWHKRSLCCLGGRHAVTGFSPRQDKKAVSCRQDWHQTGSQVVVTIYAKNPLPALSSVKANRTVVSGAGKLAGAFMAPHVDEPTATSRPGCQCSSAPVWGWRFLS